MPVKGAYQQVSQELAGWRDIQTQPHRFGGLEWVLGRREIGHIHGDALVDIPFTKAVRDEVVAARLAERHHVLPESGWVSVWLRRPEDVDNAIELLRRSYGIAVAQAERMKEGTL
jgi:hypothetical protein